MGSFCSIKLKLISIEQYPKVVCLPSLWSLVQLLHIFLNKYWSLSLHCQAVCSEYEHCFRSIKSIFCIKPPLLPSWLTLKLRRSDGHFFPKVENQMAHNVNASQLGWSLKLVHYAVPLSIVTSHTHTHTHTHAQSTRLTNLKQDGKWRSMMITK